MENNQEQALQAAMMAETKFAEKDYFGALAFAQKAKNLYPMMNFISKFISIIEIYCSKQKVQMGHSSWHNVLRLNESAKCPEICESFYKLVDLVNASKNDVIGVEGAYQILSEAFCNATNTFWTECRWCGFRFLFDDSRIKDKIMCKNCAKTYVAVPLGPGDHPVNLTTRDYKWQCQDGGNKEVVLALNKSDKDGESSKRAKKRMKKDNGEVSFKG